MLQGLIKMTLQRYVSKELVHFVGRKDPENHERNYNTLISIIKDKKLIYPERQALQPGIIVDSSKQFSGNELYNPDCVCFCDIPVSDLDIHMNKYGRFGLSFLKSFLSGKGANPVFYIAKNSISHAGYPRSQYFDYMQKIIQNLYNNDIKNIKTGPTTPISDFWNFLHFQVFSFLKFFDDTKSDTEEKNYYMEREWRIMDNLEFNLEDVFRVILPKSYSECFRRDMPNYIGQITFAD